MNITKVTKDPTIIARIIRNSRVLKILGSAGRIKSTMWRPALITPAIRSEFLSFPFSKQAELIGFFAQKQLRSVNKEISKLLPKGILEAKDLWKQIVEYGKDKGLSYSQTIALLHPQLKSKCLQIAGDFAEAFAFWVENYYSCNSAGDFTPYTYLASKALILNPHQIEIIDKMSGMPYLGEKMKWYADFLTHTTEIFEL